ncbi:hypothetical protein [Pectobacterium carotovorum]|uniref:hypothetical protein n=1 Tax=Pectobacterium carotovorum TaxID=554 RepID=UPI0011C47269|nr:hypothetical protein [Pectobacterium carotovorum]
MSFNDRSPVSVLFSIASLTSALSVMGKDFLIEQYAGNFLTCKRNINYGKLYIRCNQSPPAKRVTDKIINAPLSSVERKAKGRIAFYFLAH